LAEHTTTPHPPGAMQPEVEQVLSEHLSALKEIDGDVYEYVGGILNDVEAHGCDAETLQESVAPFLLSSGLMEDEAEADAKVAELAEALRVALGLGTVKKR
jgi:hypothetical protein